MNPMEMMNAMANPQEYAKQMIGQNPSLARNITVQNAMNMAMQGNDQGVEQIARNMAQSKGINLNQFLCSLGMK